MCGNRNRHGRLTRLQTCYSPLTKRTEQMKVQFAFSGKSEKPKAELEGELSIHLLAKRGKVFQKQQTGHTKAHTVFVGKMS